VQGAPAPEPGLPRRVQSESVPGQGVLVPDDPVAAVAGMDHDVHDVRPVAGSSRLPIELRPRREAHRGGLRQDPGRAAEWLAGTRTYGCNLVEWGFS